MHREYLHVGKGRDLGFNSVPGGWLGWFGHMNLKLLLHHKYWIVIAYQYFRDFQQCIANYDNLQVLFFFAKLSQGTGEQLLTRQMFRLGHEMATCTVDKVVNGSWYEDVT